MNHQPDYHSFLVRLWRDQGAGGRGEPPAWRGEMLHIQSGEKWLLHDLEEALVLLKAATEDE